MPHLRCTKHRSAATDVRVRSLLGAALYTVDAGLESGSIEMLLPW